MTEPQVTKYKNRWLVHRNSTIFSKTKLQNMVTQLPGVKRVAKEAKTVFDYWKLFSQMKSFTISQIALIKRLKKFDLQEISNITDRQIQKK